MSADFFYINNTKLVNELKKNGSLYKANQEYALAVFTTVKNQKKIYIKFKLTFNDACALKPIDFLIMDAVYNIYCEYNTEYGNVFSLRQLYRIITGETDSKKQLAVSKERLDMLKERVDSLRSIDISIDCRAEAKARKKLNSENYIINAPLLPIEPKGKKYRITDVPPLYQYSDISGQVLRIPLNRYYCINSNGEKAINNTIRTILIKYYLIHELEVMRSTEENNRFNYKSIPFFKHSVRKSECDRGILTQLHSKGSDKYWFLETGETVKSKSIIGDHLDEPSVRHTISEIEKTVCDILDFYISDGYIKSYKIEKVSKRAGCEGMPLNITDIKFKDDVQKSSETEAEAVVFEKNDEAIVAREAETTEEQKAEIAEEPMKSSAEKPKDNIAVHADDSLHSITEECNREEEKTELQDESECTEESKSEATENQKSETTEDQKSATTEDQKSEATEDQKSETVEEPLEMQKANATAKLVAKIKQRWQEEREEARKSRELAAKNPTSETTEEPLSMPTTNYAAKFYAIIEEAVREEDEEAREEYRRKMEELKKDSPTLVKWL